MGLGDILLLAGVFLLMGLIGNRKIRHYALLLCSVFFVFKLQPQVPVRGFDFWFPCLTFALVLFTFGLYGSFDRDSLIDSIVILAAVLAAGSTRFISYDGILTASRPPLFRKILIFCAIVTMLCFALRKIPSAGKRSAFTIATVLMILFLAVIKTPALSRSVSRLLRGLTGQNADMAAAGDLRWFGFSYIAFRLLSVLIDCGKGRKLNLSAGDFLIYVCFPPALSAGPIDRPDRFAKDLSREEHAFSEDLSEGGKRIAVGLFRKFILADSIAKFALSASNAGRFISRGWAWFALIAYALQIYFDFAGYSDIAIGLGNLLGFRLPENFNHPYLKPDLTKFWSNWHMTLTQWIRSYVFNPLTRSLRSNKEKPLPQWLIILITQLVTMTLIGLWHGVSLNFLIWGLWHGIGLFVHQMYGKRMASVIREFEKNRPTLKKVYTVFTTLLTCLYVALGWIWFVTSDLPAALAFFGRLFG